ncbi:hypothetical protein ACFQO7_16755 [Catellatospora aurea]|uniref:FXSXX-COOH protein n=1 Tax=Catellatospora aurea TaxID=1337874 RepID=A0ABW2GVW8_9ACTN
MPVESDMPDSRAIPDVNPMSLVELLHNRDPDLMAAVQQLVSTLSDTDEIRLGWQSAIDV